MSEKINRSKRKIIIKLLLMVVIVASSFSFVIYTYFYGLLSNFSENTNSKSTIQSILSVISKNKATINLLVYGVDNPDPNIPNEPGGSDSIMIVHISPEEKKMEVVAVPRDTKVVYEGKWKKLTDLNRYLEGNKDLSNSSEVLEQVIENLLGIKINFYVRMNYNSLGAIVDSIGGVDVIPKYDMKYVDESQGLSINFDKGQNYHLDGRKAEEFFRWRKNNIDGYINETDGSDLTRIKNQRILMKALIDKVSSFDTITEIPSLIKMTSKYVKTNMSTDDMLSYGLVGLKLKNTNIDYYTLQGITPAYGPNDIYKISYFIYEPDLNKNVIEILKGK